MTKIQNEILELIKEKPRTRAELRLLNFKSPRKELRLLERFGLIKKEEKYLENKLNPQFKKVAGTVYYEYSYTK